MEWVDQLNDLANLFRTGGLTEEEFTKAKAAVLNLPAPTVRLSVHKDNDAISAELALTLTHLANDSIAKRGRFVTAWSGGSLPAIACAKLAQTSQDWDKWFIFYADERFVEHSHPDSNHGLLTAQLLSKVPIPTSNIFAINSTAASVEQAATEYQAKVQELLGRQPVFDLMLLGMGPDGHTCSLFPGHPLLAERSRIIAPIFDSPKPPPQRITFTFPTINRSRQVFFVTAGAGKAEMLHSIIRERPDELLPCQRVQGNVTWFVDEGAARLL
eukprot:c39161_g1_i1.p1 GENE.c39161_g1_i1~~c39161_g1_i1.p1  ORF type:complete len:271 (+),score=57.33 c39161_g1_i1:24-836(+)